MNDRNIQYYGHIGHFGFYGILMQRALTIQRKLVNIIHKLSERLNN